MQEEDLALPTNLKDPQSKTTYFQGAQALARNYSAGTAIQNISAATVGTNYWENVFPAAKGQAGSVLLETPITSGPNAGLIQPCGANSTLISPTTLLTATQAMYDLFCNYSGNETTALELADSPGLINAMGDPVTGGCFPACANINGTLSQGYDYYSPQFSSMDAWRSIGNSSYNAAQFSLRHRANGLEFDLNYTYSRSMDDGSNAERVSTFRGRQLSPAQSSTPGSRGRIAPCRISIQLKSSTQTGSTNCQSAAASTSVQAWEASRMRCSATRTLSGLWRYSTGYPFTLYSPEWATNYDLENPAVPLSSARPKLGTTSWPKRAVEPARTSLRIPESPMQALTRTPRLIFSVRPIPARVDCGMACAAPVHLILIRL